MMVDGDEVLESKDAHATPPTRLRQIYKEYQKRTISDINSDPTIVDFAAENHGSHGVHRHGHVPAKTIRSACQQIVDPGSQSSVEVASDGVAYEFSPIPGLFIFPALLPPATQLSLLSRLLHRDLSDPRHMTNVHLHHSLHYPAGVSTHPYNNGSPSPHPSFFSLAPSTPNIGQAKQGVGRRSMTAAEFLNKKLRWITLGYQYDWTNKVYPAGPPPAFPHDLARLLRGLFPDMSPQAAIVNLYSPGDTLSLHRDVSEECDRGLISLSLGCDALFMVGLDERQVSPSDAASPQAKSTVIRLHSGDVVYMSGKARYAWHGVPKIIANTCPRWMEEWPAASPQQGEIDVVRHDGTSHDAWRGWMASRRINLNVRQHVLVENDIETAPC